MKILAIRGQNLASLARTFEIDLVGGPLRDVGLFAITGPVGAGKSTLLDALCLALFDRTPRLSNRGGVPVGDEGCDRGDWLRSNDVRTLLRRDAAEGFAEVDFTGRDRRRYRARWSVRRARRRPDGRVQDQDMSLVDLDRGVVVAKDRKTEVLAAIEARLGLDFGQFCRSVLLAQGEFAAFLHANADERARLLENLTGADVYRKLSRAAHARCKAEAEVVQKLRAQFDAQQLLDAGARAALEGECARLAEEVTTCGAAVELAQRYVGWYAVEAERQREEAEATVALRAARERDAAAEPRRLWLQLLQQACGLQQHWQLAQRRRHTAQVAGEALASARRAVDRADADVAAARAALAPILRSAFGDLDAVPSIVREFDRHDAALQRRVAAETRLAALAARRPQLAAAAATAAAAVPVAQQRVAGAAAAQQAAGECVRAAGAALAAPDLAGRAARRSAVADRRETLQRVRRLLDEADGFDEAVRAAAARAAAATAERDRLAAAFPPLVEVREQAAAALQAARREGEHARSVAGLEALRAQLRDGEPCPLCGAHEHPAAGAPPLDVDAAERAVATAQQSFDAARGAVVESEAQRRQAEQQVTAAVRELSGLTEVAQQARDELLRAVREDRATAGATTFAEVAARLAAGDAEVAEEERAIAALDVRARELAGAHAEAVVAAAEANDGLHAARTALQGAERDLAEAAAAVARAADETRHLQELLADQALALGPAFAGADDWCERIARGRDAWLGELRRAHDLDAKLATAEQVAAEARRRLADAVALQQRTAEEADAEAAALAEAVRAAGVQEAHVAEAARLGAAALALEAEALAEVRRTVERCRGGRQGRAEQLKKHGPRGRPSLDADEARGALELARARKQAAERDLIDKKGQLGADDRVRRQREELAPRLDAAERKLAVWQALDDLIGSSDGGSFVVFAQGLTLDLLLVEANHRLEELARRYRLERNPGGEMDFVVVDLDMGGSRRGLRTLSGGETFLVSLALALALATLAAPRSRVETLFLDEGFGTLDAHNLETALGALDALQATGCQVGVISHVEGFAERIGAAVEVRPSGGGRSRVLVRLQ